MSSPSPERPAAISSSAGLTVALVSTLLLSTTGGAVAAWAVARSVEHAGEIARREERTAYLVSAIALDLSEARSNLRQALTDPGARAEPVVEDARAQITSARAESAELATLLGGEERALWGSLGPGLDAMLGHIERATDALARHEPRRAGLLLDENAGASHRLFHQLEEFRRVSLAETDRAVEDIGRETQRTIRIASASWLALAAVLALAWTLILRLLAGQRRALADRMQALEAANRELEAFSGRVAHDMRDVLSPIGLGVEVIEKTSRDPAMLGVAQRIGRSSARGRELVEGLLVFSRAAGRPGAAPGEAEIARELADVLDQLEQPIRAAGVQVETRVPPAARVAVPPALFHVVLANLVGNAVKFMRGCPERKLAIEASEHVDGWRIELADTGKGIPAAELGRVFEALYRGARSTGSGVGLGLATAKRIVESHGGHIELASTPGRGTTVTLVLPRAAAIGSDARDAVRDHPPVEPAPPPVVSTGWSHTQPHSAGSNTPRDT